jgi:hypothetical protein
MKNYIGASILISLVVFLIYLPEDNDPLASVRDNTRAATSIVAGTVTNQQSYYGPDGEIYSDITIESKAALKETGRKGAGLVTLTIKGGNVGDTHVVFTDVPSFDVDEAVVVFLQDSAVRAKYTVRDGQVPELGVSAARVLDAIEKALDRPLLEGERRRAKEFVAERATAPATAVTACFALIGPNWSDSLATYKFNANIPAAWHTALHASAASWGNAGTVFKFKQEAASPNEFLMGTVASASTLASTRIEYDSTLRLRKFTMTFNQSVPWTATGEPGKFDVENVTAHELGHALGLNHPSGTACGEQTMWATAAAGETKKRSLETGDKEGAAKLYLAASPAPPTPPPPPPAPGPVFTTAYLFPAVPKVGQSFTLWTYGSGFQVTSVQIVISGPACPSLCVFTPGYAQPSVLSLATKLAAKGNYSVAIRNGPAGTASAAKSFTVE